MANTSIIVSGTKNPIVKYVYLVQEVSDSARMGGTANNTYTNAQLAWDAVMVIILANPTYRVVLQVGATTAAGVGAIVITGTNDLERIQINGISSQVSAIGNITYATTGVIVHISNITVGDILGTPSSLFYRSCVDLVIGNCTNTSGIFIIWQNCIGILVGNLALSGIPTSAAALQFYNSTIRIGDISGTDLNIQGTIEENPNGGNKGMVGVGNVTITNTRHHPINLKNMLIRGNLSLSCNFASATIGTTTMREVTILGTTTILRAGNPQPIIIENSTFAGTFTMTGTTTNPVIIRGSDFAKIVNLPATTTVMNTTIYDSTAVTPAINGIGTGCEMYNTSIVGGSLSIDNGVPVSVKFTTGSSSAKAAMGANITLT